eukprot:5996640-Pyramimonas_sp.AAC.1
MTLAALELSLLRILKMLRGSLDGAPIVWFGAPCAGKTAAPITVALARKRELGGEPPYIAASEMDFFRQVASTPKCPVILVPRPPRRRR